jgi:hypothetical protein
MFSGLISSVIATLNRTTVTSDALTSLYDLVRLLSLQLGVSRTLWSLVLIVIIIFLNSFPLIIIHSSPQLHSVLAGKDYIQEPFLSEGGAAALLHAMCVHHPCHCLTPISHSHHHRNCLQHIDHVTRLFSGQSYRNLPVSPRASTCCATAAAACMPVASSAIQARDMSALARRQSAYAPAGCIERLADVIHRTQGRHNVCCIAAIRTLVHIAEKSSIGIRETYVTSGCLKLLLEVTCDV